MAAAAIATHAAARSRRQARSPQGPSGARRLDAGEHRATLPGAAPRSRIAAKGVDANLGEERSQMIWSAERRFV